MHTDRLVLNRGYGDLNPVSCGRESCKPGHAFGYAVRDYYLVHYVVSGRGIFIRGGVTHELSRHGLFLIRPGESTYYRADEEEPWEYIWVGYDGPGCERHLETTGFSGDRCVLTAPQAGRIFEALFAVPDRTPETELLLCSRLYELMAAMQQSPSRRDSPAGEHVARAADYLRARCADGVTVGDAASLLGLDRRYLCRIFKERTGRSPREYLLELRLERAASLLRETGCTVGEAARSVGYEDAFLFSKMFKRRYGKAPLHYRDGGE